MSRLNVSNPIIQADATMEPHFRDFLLLAENAFMNIGTGTPEGSLYKPQGSLYMDTAGASGAVLYVKRDTDVGGDTTQGWIAV